MARGIALPWADIERAQRSLWSPYILGAAVLLSGRLSLSTPEQHPEDPSERVSVRLVEVSRPTQPKEPIVAPTSVAEVSAPPKPQERTNRSRPATARDKTPIPRPKPSESARREQPSIEQTAAPVAIIGLTLESTSRGGGGPAFATGNSLSGETARVANDPSKIGHGDGPRAPIAQAPTGLRAARTRPSAGVVVTPPKRLSRIEPDYPKLLLARGIEADVTVRVALSETGAVTSVEVLSNTGSAEFGEAALRAAQRERFSPERHAGQSVSTSITYSYRFRITP